MRISLPVLLWLQTVGLYPTIRSALKNYHLVYTCVDLLERAAI